MLTQVELNKRGGDYVEKGKKQEMYIGSVTQYELVGDQEQLDWRC